MLSGILRKNSGSIQLATNKTCHSGLSPPPTPTCPQRHTLSPYHMLVCSTTLFTFLLANYLPLSSFCLGAWRSGKTGDRRRSLIERLSGDYEEVRNEVVVRNHKHKPFHSLCFFHSSCLSLQRAHLPPARLCAMLHTHWVWDACSRMS